MHRSTRFILMSLFVAILAISIVLLAPAIKEHIKEYERLDAILKTPPTTVPRSSGNPAHDAVSAMSEFQRREAFGHLLIANQEPCGFVTDTFFQGMIKATTKASWNVRCANGTSFYVILNPDMEGSGKTMNCATLQAAAPKARCFVSF